MDIIGIGYIGFETTKIDEWRSYGPEVMGFQIGRTPESDPGSLYFRIDDRRHRFAFHPGTTDRVAYIGWEAKGKIEFEQAVARFREHGVELAFGDAALLEQRQLRNRRLAFYESLDPAQQAQVRAFLIEVSERAERAIRAFEVLQGG